MNRLDKLIKDALPPKDHDILKATAEQGWFALGLNQFSGKLGWVTWVIVIVQAAFLVAGIYAAVKFFGATDVLTALKWGLSGAVLLLMAALMKMSLMPQMQAERILRELKRVELLIVRDKG